MKRILLALLALSAVPAQAATVAVSCNGGDLQLVRMRNPNSFPYYAYLPVFNHQNGEAVKRHLFGAPELGRYCAGASLDSCAPAMAVWPAGSSTDFVFNGSLGSAIKVESFISSTNRRLYFRTSAQGECYYGGCNYRELRNWVFDDCDINWDLINSG